MNNPLTLEEAVECLENNICLIASVEGKLTYFRKIHKQIKIFNKNTAVSVSFDDLIKLYKGYTFYIYESDDSTIDFEKDEQYYSWTHK